MFCKKAYKRGYAEGAKAPPETETWKDLAVKSWDDNAKLQKRLAYQYQRTAALREENRKLKEVLRNEPGI